MHNPENWPEEHGVIESVSDSGDSLAVTFDGGWTMLVFKDEVDIFVKARGRKPQPGDRMTSFGGFGRPITGVVIDDVVLRYKTRADVERERQEWLDQYEKKKIARYYENINRWQSEVEALHPTLKARIRRFERDNGAYEFWKEDGGYEMAVMNGANALLKWVDSVAGTTEDKLQYLDWWWSLNTEEHGYDYKKQMEVVPDFGEGHSGNTASAAYSFAKFILKGEYTE